MTRTCRSASTRCADTISGFCKTLRHFHFVTAGAAFNICHDQHLLQNLKGSSVKKQCTRLGLTCCHFQTAQQAAGAWNTTNGKFNRFSQTAMVTPAISGLRNVDALQVTAGHTMHSIRSAALLHHRRTGMLHILHYAAEVAECADYCTAMQQLLTCIMQCG